MKCQITKCELEADYVSSCTWNIKHKACTCTKHAGRLITDHSEVCEGPLIVTQSVTEGWVLEEVRVVVCPVCNGEGEHDWEVHTAEYRAGMHQ